MYNQLIENVEGFEETEVQGYEGETMPDNPDETEQPPIVNEQGEDVVNDGGNNNENVPAESEIEPDTMPEPGGDSPPPEIEIDPETPEVVQPTMAS